MFTEVSDCATLDSWGWVSGDPVPAPGPRRRGCQHTGVTTLCSRIRRNFTSCSPSLSACCNCNGLLPAEHYQIVPNVGWIGFLPRRGAPGFCKYWETLRRLEVGLQVFVTLTKDIWGQKIWKVSFMCYETNPPTFVIYCNCVKYISRILLFDKAYFGSKWYMYHWNRCATIQTLKEKKY